MIIKYKIVSTFPDEHQIMVRFYTDALPESQLVSSWMPDGVTPKSYRTDYLITVPFPVPDDFDGFIMAHCPVGWFDLKEKIADPAVDTSMSFVQVGVEKSVTL